MSQGNAAGGVVHEMVLAERWSPENRNLFNLIVIGNATYPALVLICCYYWKYLPPIRHWCSPSVLPLPHSSPLSSKPALQEPRRTSHPEREEEIRIMLSGGIFPPRSPSRPRFIGSRSRRWCRWKGGFSRLGCFALGVDRQLVDRPGHRGEKLPEKNETVRKPVKP